MSAKRNGRHHGKKARNVGAMSHSKHRKSGGKGHASRAEREAVAQEANRSAATRREETLRRSTMYGTVLEAMRAEGIR